MPLIGKACSRTPDIVDKIAEQLGCEAAVIDAIIATETVGDAFDNNGRLIVRPEVHKVAVCPYLTTQQKKQAAKLGFTKKVKWLDYGSGSVSNQRAGDQRWDWLDRFRNNFGDEAAYWITSFGSPQIMGFNFRKCGFTMPSHMVAEFAESEDAQLAAMCNFLKSSGLGPALRQRQWKQIARLYNGADYAKNRYDAKLAAAYEASGCRKGSVLFDPLDDEMLQFGDHGEAVKLLQAKLRGLGFYVDGDGDFGMETRDAVMALQRRAGVTVDGKVGPLTRRAIEEMPPKEPNQKPVAKIIAESTTAQAGVATTVIGGIATAVSSTSVATDAMQPQLSFENAEKMIAATERGVGVAQKALALGVDKILIAIGLSALIFGLLTLYRRVIAQRLRKVG